jgi:hypothetical protein
MCAARIYPRVGGETKSFDLVRGIHPPVLADGGLADAVRAFALDSPLDISMLLTR